MEEIFLKSHATAEYCPDIIWISYLLILCHVVFFWGLDLEEIFLKSPATVEYCPDIIWISYLLNLFGYSFDRGQTDCCEFWGYCSLLFDLDFLEPVLCICYEYYNEDEDNSMNILSDKTHQVSSQKF